MKYQSTVIKYGDHIDTDVIIPARYLNTSEPAALAAHCMEDLDAQFPERVKQSHIIIAGENFGCGSSREHAPIALKASGIELVIAKSFARIFYRNAINIGLAIVECPSASEDAQNGDEIEADLDSGIIRNLSAATEYQIAPFPPFIQIAAAANGALQQDSITIRRFTDADADAVSAVICETIRISNSKDYPPDYIKHLCKTHSPEHMTARAKEAHSYVICDRETVIGCGSIAPYWGSETESILLTIFVLPDYQGRGIGRKLIETLEQDAFGVRAKRIEIPASITAVAFYKKCGYQYKNGVAELDPQLPLYRMEKFPKKGVSI